MEQPEETVLYVKKDGEYLPVGRSDPEYYHYKKHGHYLVSVSHNHVITRHLIEPALPPTLAAAHYAREAMTAAMMKNESSFHGQSRDKDAWERFLKETDGRFTIRHNSFAQVVDSGINELVSQTNHLMANPAVKIAYQEFMTLCRLALDEGK